MVKYQVGDFRVVSFQTTSHDDCSRGLTKKVNELRLKGWEDFGNVTVTINYKTESVLMTKQMKKVKLDCDINIECECGIKVQKKNFENHINSKAHLISLANNKTTVASS
jgi:hypothetical protein